jgi:predicted nucleic acid-binding protein
LLISDPRIQVVITEEQWDETQHELERRLRYFGERGGVTEDQLARIRQDILDVIDAVEIAPRYAYAHLESIARRRIPRDPNDWPTIALALALEEGILTYDNDFLGCGCATWTVDTLSSELEAGDVLYS